MTVALGACSVDRVRVREVEGEMREERRARRRVLAVTGRLMHIHRLLRARGGCAAAVVAVRVLL